MDQTSGHVQAKAQQPKDQKYSHNRPKHISLLRLALFYFCPLEGDGTERLPALQTKSLGSRRDPPAEWTHSLQSSLLDPRLEHRQQLSKEFSGGSQTSTERRTIRFHSISPLRISPLILRRSDNWTMTGQRPQICAGLLIFLVIPFTSCRESLTFKN